MSNIFRNFFAVVTGLIVGGAVNMTLVIISPHMIPPPAGVDVTDAKSIAASMHLFEPKHFVFPFLAHALGTLVGAFVAYRIAGSYRLVCSYIIGAVFLLGGIAAAAMIPAPVWFIILDLVVAYIPMAWIAAQIGRGIGGGANG